MKIQLSDHFTFQRLFRFTIPSIAMMILTSIYSIVDGLFVSNFVGKIPFAALNMMYPFMMAISTVGFMLGTGGSAVVAITLGEGKKQKAQEYFSMIIYVVAVIGIIVSITAFIFMKPIALMLGASFRLYYLWTNLSGWNNCIYVTNYFSEFFCDSAKAGNEFESITCFRNDKCYFRLFICSGF